MTFLKFAIFQHLPPSEARRVSTLMRRPDEFLFVDGLTREIHPESWMFKKKCGKSVNKLHVIFLNIHINIYIYIVYKIKKNDLYIYIYQLPQLVHGRFLKVSNNSKNYTIQKASCNLNLRSIQGWFHFGKLEFPLGSGFGFSRSFSL